MADHTVVDVDAHYMDHIDDMYDYLDDDDPWKAKFKQELDRENDNIGSFWPKDSGVTFPGGWERSDFHEKGDVLETMDRLGVDKVLLIGQQMLNIPSVKGDDLRPIKYTEAYVQYLLDNIADPSEGIYVTIPVTHSDPDLSAEMIDEYGVEEAVAGAVVVPKYVEPPFGNHRYDPIYDACERLDLPVVFHGAGSAQDQYHLKGFYNHMETSIAGFLTTMINTVTSVVIEGVPVRFPDLDIVFEEAGLFYVPMMMYRMDKYYLMTPDDAPLLDKLPSEYMKEFYYGTQPLEEVPDPRYFEWVIEMLGGVDRLLYATDWPHADHDETNAIIDLPFLSEKDKAKILSENAEEVFGI